MCIITNTSAGAESMAEAYLSPRSSVKLPNIRLKKNKTKIKPYFLNTQRKERRGRREITLFKD